MLRRSDNSRTAFTHCLRTLSFGMVAMVLAAAEQGAHSEWQLEAAIHREIVLGDLPGAIAQYKTVLAQAGNARTVAARALFQIGQCLDKQGQRKDAHDAYRRIVNEYSDQPEIVAEARVRLASWQDAQPGPRNLKFEEGVPGKVPPGWFVPSLPRDADYSAELRRNGCRSAGGCAVVLVPANAPRPLGTLMQSFSADAYRGKTVRLRAWLRLEIGLRESDANPEDRAQMWLTVDRANRRVGFSDNMDDRPLRSAEWTRCEITGEIDEDAQFINFGFMSIGRGRVWVDDVSFEIVK